MKEKIVSGRDIGTVRKETSQVKRKVSEVPFKYAMKRKLDSKDSRQTRPSTYRGGGPSASKSKRLTLSEEFDGIVESARSAGTKRNKRPWSKPPLPRSPVRQLNSQLDDCRSPLRRNLGINDIPSPIMTPAAPRNETAILVRLKDPPSPQGMDLLQPSQSSTSSLHHVTQATSIKQEVKEDNEEEEASFFEAADTSLNSSGGGLDLDNLIDELFVKSGMSVKTIEKNELIPLPSGDNFNLAPEKECKLIKPIPLPSTEISNSALTVKCEPIGERMNEILTAPVAEPAIFVTSAETSGHTCTPTPVSSRSIPAAIHSPDIFASSAEIPGQTCTPLPASSVCEPASASSQASEDGCTSDPPVGAQRSHASVVGGRWMSPIPTSDSLVPRTDTTVDEKNVVPMSQLNGNKLRGEEAFTDDLDLSNSQYLDIDEQCALLEEIHKSPSRKTDVDQEHGDSAFRVKKPVNLAFTVPASLSMVWVQETKERCQRLRTLTQEISRLNALVLRARRTMWPLQQSTQMPHQHKMATSAVSKDHPPPPQSVPQLYLHTKMPIPSMSCDPEWNIS